MNPQVRKTLNRLKQTIQDIETMDLSFWNAGLGTSHLSAMADQLVNDAKSVAAHMKAYGKK